MTKKEKKKKFTDMHPGYSLARKEGWDLMVESSSCYDKALITLSTAFLGFIFAVVKWSSSWLICKPFLILILVFLIIAIVSSLLSFWFDQIYGDSKINYANKYYYEKKDEYLNKKHWSYYASIITKIISGVLFIFSLILFSVLFFSNMGKDKDLSLHNPQVVIIDQNYENKK